MHSKSHNIEIIIKQMKVIEELFKSLLNRYQNNLEKLMNGIEFVFDYVYLLHHKYHKINPNHGGSNIDSPDLIKNKKATINPIIVKDNKYFQYAVIVALSHEEVKKDPQKITKIKFIINKYNWEGINFPSEKDDLKKFEKNNLAIAINVLYAEKEKIYPAYVSKHNSNCENKLFFLIIANGEGWCYII